MSILPRKKEEEKQEGFLGKLFLRITKRRYAVFSYRAEEKTETAWSTVRIQNAHRKKISRSERFCERNKKEITILRRFIIL